MGVIRELVERRRDGWLWGQKYRITPRLVTEVFGDGKQAIALEPMNLRPNFYVVRIDSGWNLDTEDGGRQFREVLDDVIWAIVDDFGEAHCCYCRERYGDDGCKECKGAPKRDGEFPAADFEVGCSWGALSVKTRAEMGDVEAAAILWYQVKELRMRAKDDLLAYRQEHGSCPGVRAGNYHVWEERPEWCEVCRGAQPLYLAYRKAARALGTSLRALNRACKAAPVGR